MIVAELAIILDHVPPDLPVIIQSARGAVHIGHVHRHTYMRHPYKLLGAPDERPASILLEGPYGPGRSMWFDPEPEYQLHGRFQRAADLDYRLDNVR